jgi:hypothetical protein
MPGVPHDHLIRHPAARRGVAKRGRRLPDQPALAETARSPARLMTKATD